MEYYSFTDPEGWKAELVEFAKPITDILPRKCSNMPTIDRAQSGKVQRPKTYGLITEVRHQPCLADLTEAFASFVCLMWPNSEDAKISITTKVTLKWIQIITCKKTVCARSNIKPVARVKKRKGRNFSTAIFPDHTRQCSSLKLCVRGTVWELVQNIKYDLIQQRISELYRVKIALCHRVVYSLAVIL